MPFNIGPGELILILIIALVVLGPGKLPDVASSLGKSIREFRKAATDVTEAGKLDSVPSTPASPVSAAPAAQAAADAAPAAPASPPPPPAPESGDDVAAAPTGASPKPARDPNLS